MIQRKTRHRRITGATKVLVGLIAILAVLLVAAICIAVSLDPQNADPIQSTGTQDEPSKDTAAPIGLIIESPLVRELLWMEKTLRFTGMSDPNESLTVNGSEVSRNADGSFSYEAALTVGMNEIVFSHKGETVRYGIEHRYAVESYFPDKAAEYNSGQTIELEISVRKGSTVKVQLGDKTIAMEKMQPQPENQTAEFELYVGTYRLPADNAKDLDMGKAVFTVTYDGTEEIYESGTILCKKSADVLSSDPSVTPDYGDYIDVGSGYIVQIVTYSAETFDGNTRDDYSDPRNNYLPEGTLDYGLSEQVYDTSGKMAYRLLRCGYRIYTQRKNYPDANKVQVVECYKGTLPDHNEVGFASMRVEGSHTVLTLNTMWKAPFYFDLKPQTYNDPGARDFKISALTAEYVEITFCYATKFEGTVDISADNPLFRSATLTQNEADCTLRLYLKEKGGFYGWDSYYNDQDQLCFQFLNPTPAKTADNAYGADLTGIRVMIDVGHGGVDGGSPATTADGKTVEEADLNLNLAKVLQKELESMGATVIMNRTDDSNLTVDQRIQFVKNQAPDLCIAVHHNSYKPLASVNGCDVMYFSPNSQLAADAVYQQIKTSGVYNKTMLKWNVYYVARESVCPVVLVECGYMTNPEDLAGALDPNVVQQKAKDMAQGVANYFLQLG